MSAQAHIPASELRKVVRGSWHQHEDLVRAGLQLLALRGVEAVPLHTGPKVAPREGGGFDLRKNPLQRGVADIAGCIPPHGRHLEAEAKTGTARRKPAQVRRQERVERAGGVYILFRDVADLDRQLKPHLHRKEA